MKRSYLIAGALALAAAGWIASGQLAGETPPKTGRKPPADLTAAETLPTVRVRSQRATWRTVETTLRGRTEAERKVQVKAETHGRIVEFAADEGDDVEAGDVLARLSAESRPAVLAEARALREQRRIEYEAARKLSEKGFRAENQLAAAKAALEAAEAAVARAQVELANTTITAPFDGIVGERMMEFGDYVEPGDPILRIVDLDPILVVAQVSERDVGRLWTGGPARVRLITGERVEGTLRYVAAEADSATRTFRVEVEVANPDGAVPDGVTAELVLPLERTLAHRVSPAVLTLNDDGVIGVKTIGPDERVAFRPVQIVGETTDGVWLTGLPEEVTLITVGQEFATEGQRVRPIDEATLDPLDAARGAS